MRIGIRFGDNDFHYTFMPLLETLPMLLEYRDLGNSKPTKAEIVEFINEVSYGFHIFCQSYNYRRDTPKEVEHSRRYLKITEEKVYIDEEIDEFLANRRNHLNGDFFYIDTNSKQSAAY